MHLSKHKARGCIFREMGSFIPFTYLGIALDRGLEQSSNLAWLEYALGSHCMGVVLHICVCPCVCECMLMN